MNPKKSPRRIKKTLYNLALTLLTSGASLILGLLSFSGMYALYQALSSAFATFALSVTYEGEIYLQNIKGALSKLFEPDYLQNRLGKDFLLTHFPNMNPALSKFTPVEVNILKSLLKEKPDREIQNILKATKNYKQAIFTADQTKRIKALIEGSNKNTMVTLEPLEPEQFDALKSFLQEEADQDIQDILKKANYYTQAVFTEEQAKRVETLLENSKIEQPHATFEKQELSTKIVNQDYPKFFKNFKEQLELLNSLKSQKLDKEQVQNSLEDMTQWFAQRLFAPDQAEEQSAFALEVQQWLAKNQSEERQKLVARQERFIFVKWFSALAALFMTLGSTYLITEAFSVIPFLSAIPLALLPVIILPMAVIAGVAYGLLTYNTITDLINNNSVLKWYNKLKEDLSRGLTVRNVFMAATTVVVVALAAALTVCTAGTWWTIAKNSRPLFAWMSKMPSFVMGVINPIVTGASAIFFNVENTLESLVMIDEASRNEQNFLQTIGNAIKENWANLRKTENWLQIVNPFRLLLLLTVTPLRIVAFIGHLYSIARTTDRMPGVSQSTSVGISFFCEGLEDAHYFSKHDHKHNDFSCMLKDYLSDDSGHNHNVDIPTRLLHLLATPIYALAALWDSAASQLNTKHETRQVRSFAQSWDILHGTEKPESVMAINYPSTPEWQVEQTVFLIEKQSKILAQARMNTPLAQEKITQLNALKTKVRTQGIEVLEENLAQEKTNPVYNKHRLFALEQTTETQEFIEDLPYRVVNQNLGNNSALYCPLC